MLPIVERELRVGARNPKLYARRVRWGIIQSLGACAVLLFSAGGFRRGSAQWFFNTFSNLALILCLFEGIRKASDAISSEKREGTLGFLFLSTLTGADVVLGKFSAALIRSLSVLLPFLPILAISLLVGGTTLGEFWRVALALIVTLVASLSLCLLISSVSREESIGLALLALVGLCVMPWLAGLAGRGPKWLKLLSPIQIMGAARDFSYTRVPQEFWTGIAFLFALSLPCLTLASIATPRFWQERRIKTPRVIGKGVARSKQRCQLLDQNPVLWLTYDGRSKRILTVAGILLLLTGAVPLLALIAEFGNSDLWLVFPGISTMILCLLIWLFATLRVPATIAEAKLDGSLELLLTTPVTVDEVIKGYWLAFWKTIGVAVFCLVTLLVIELILAARDSSGQIVPAIVATEALLEIGVLGALGMWMGLVSKSRASAVIYTFLLGWVLPWMICSIAAILIQIPLLFRARKRVRRILKQIRAGSDTLALQDLLRGTNAANPNLPPVIRGNVTPAAR